jgi:hypothetical protein
MKSFQQISSVVLLTTAAVMMSITILSHPQGWQTRLGERDTFLLALTLACTAILLWPRCEPATMQQ